MKKKMGVLSITSLIVLIFYSLILVSLLLWAISFSLIDYENQIWWGTGDYLQFPKKLYFENYANAIGFYAIEVEEGLGTRSVGFLEQFWNSASYAVGVAFMGTLAPCLMGYATGRFRAKMNGVIDAIVLVAMILPVVGSMPSMMNIVYSLRLNNSLIGLMIMGFSFSNMYYFIFKGIFVGLPMSYSEAAKMDGAGNFRIFVTIMLPLVKTTFLSVFTLMFVSLWNNYTTALAFAPNRPTVAYGFFRLKANTQAGYDSERMAGAMILMLPILLFYVFANKFLIGNLTVGGLKG